MLYDIRDSEKAAKTLEVLTGVSEVFWSAERYKNLNRINYSDVDQDIERIIHRNCGHIPKLKDIDLVVIHLTTSRNQCAVIKKNGIMDLRKVYELKNSELREFLDSHGIEINLNSHMLKYEGNSYDISYGICPRNHQSKDYAAWSVGRKLYFDFTVCGFISIRENSVYAGNVHRRPEILQDLDELLDTNLANEWEETHDTFEIVFQLSVMDSVYKGEDFDSEYEKVMGLLTSAYECVCIGTDTEEILCKNGVEILPDQILECNRFDAWY